MLSGAPGLSRAVAECTQPQGSHSSGDGLRTLQRYLADGRTLDAVYKALLSRAWMEPYSVSVVDKVTGILKQILLRFTPSPAVLQQIYEFCEKAPHVVDLQTTGRKALSYVKAIVQKLHKGRIVPGRDNARPAVSIPSKPSPTKAVPPASPTVVCLPTGLSPPRQQTVDRYQQHNNGDHGTASSPSESGGAGGGSLHNSGGAPWQNGGAAPHGAVGASRTSGLRGVEDAEEADLYVPSQGANWASSSPGAMPRGPVLGSGTQATDAPAWSLGSTSAFPTTSTAELTALLRQAPECSPYLVAPSASIVHSTGTASTASLPVTMSTIIRCILDVDETDIPRHLHEISEACRAEAKLAAELSSPSPRRSRQRAAQYMAAPYNQQEQLSMHESDVAAVVEVVCGPLAASSQSSSASSNAAVQRSNVTGGPTASSSGAMPAADIAIQWNAQFDADELGQECSNILIKLIMDLWLLAGSGNAYPLALRMLRRALYSASEENRCRAFDLLLNLSLHSALLKSDAEDADPATPTESLAPTPTGGEPGAPGPAPSVAAAACPVPAHVRFERWLRALLFQLLVDLEQAHEGSRDVWQSALGCTLHMVTHGGHFVAAWVRHLPHAALRGLLHACVKHAWAQELYCHLLTLASHLLQQPEASALAPGMPGPWLAAFGGVPELLAHLGRAPTAQTRAALVTVLVHHLGQQSPSQTAKLLAVLQTELAGLALQAVVLHPKEGMAGRLLEALDTVGLLGPNGLTEDGGAGSSLTAFLGRVEMYSLQAHHTSEALMLASAIETTVAHISIWTGDAPVSGTSTAPSDAEATAAAWQAFKDQCSRPGEAAREVAVEWLHQIMHRAVSICQANVLLLSPLQLKSAEANRLASGRPNAQPRQWNVALADALLHVVRGVDDGCGLLLAAHLRVVADLRSEGSLRSLNTSLKELLNTAGGNEDTVRLRRSVVAVTANGGAASGSGLGSDTPPMHSGDMHSPTSLGLNPLQGGAQTPLGMVSSHTVRLVMSTHYLSLLWMLQCGAASSGAASLATATARLADIVLMSLCAQTLDLPVPMRRASKRAARQVAAAQDVAGAIIAGRLAFSPEVLPCTPPELLVSLLQQCAQQQAALLELSRGFMGRPQPYPSGSRDTAAVTQSTHSTLDVPASWDPCGEEGVRGVGLAGGARALCFSASEGPWQASHLDRRLSMLLALMARCALDPEAFARYSLSQVLKGQLGSEDVRERYLAGVYLLKHWTLNQQDKYWRTLRQLIVQAQQLNDEQLLDNPYLQISSMLNVDA